MWKLMRFENHSLDNDHFAGSAVFLLLLPRNWRSKPCAMGRVPLSLGPPEKGTASRCSVRCFAAQSRQLVSDKESATAHLDIVQGYGRMPLFYRIVCRQSFDWHGKALPSLDEAETNGPVVRRPGNGFGGQTVLAADFDHQKSTNSHPHSRLCPQCQNACLCDVAVVPVSALSGNVAAAFDAVNSNDGFQVPGCWLASAVPRGVVRRNLRMCRRRPFAAFIHSNLN